MKCVADQVFSGERALFQSRDMRLDRCIFHDGESPLKESESIRLDGCLFQWKYPLWYCKNIQVQNSTWFENARAGVWYTRDITLENCPIDAPKNFRRCENLRLTDVSFSNAAETLWECNGVTLDRVTAKGDYFAMNSREMVIDHFTLYGNYSFDGCENVTIRNSRLLSKDAFWNSRNITVENSFIAGEYLGWNSENLILDHCTIESLQGLCYAKNLILRNCRLLNTTLAFEYSQVDAVICGRVESILNPQGGKITADEIGNLILEKEKIDPTKTEIQCPKILKISERPDYHV